MHPDDVRVGEGREQRVEIAEVRGRLQHPALAHFAAPALLPLEQLEHLVQVAVGGREVLCVEPAPVARHVAGGLGHVREEGVGEQRDLFFRFERVGRVDRLERRREGAHLPVALDAVGDARIGRRPVDVRTRRGLRDLPPVRAVAGAGRARAGAAAASSPIASCRRSRSAPRSVRARSRDAACATRARAGAARGCGGSRCGAPSRRRGSAAPRRARRAARAAARGTTRRRNRRGPCARAPRRSARSRRRGLRVRSSWPEGTPPRARRPGASRTDRESRGTPPTRSLPP